MFEHKVNLKDIDEDWAFICNHFTHRIVTKYKAGLITLWTYVDQPIEIFIPFRLLTVLSNLDANVVEMLITYQNFCALLVICNKVSILKMWSGIRIGSFGHFTYMECTGRLTTKIPELFDQKCIFELFEMREAQCMHNNDIHKHIFP